MTPDEIIQQNLREQAERTYDGLTPEAQRKTFARQHLALHNAHMAIYHFREGESTFKKPAQLIEYLETILWNALVPPPEEAAAHTIEQGDNESLFDRQEHAEQRHHESALKAIQQRGQKPPLPPADE